MYYTYALGDLFQCLFRSVKPSTVRERAYYFYYAISILPTVSLLPGVPGDNKGVSGAGWTHCLD